MPEALAHPGADPWALAVLVWLGLVNTAVVLFLETEALESVSASGERRQDRHCVAGESGHWWRCAQKRRTSCIFIFRGIARGRRLL